MRSYPIAGSLPMYMRECMSNGDTEQVLDSLYGIAGYPALGSAPSFRIEIDEGASGHTYSRNTAFNVILGDLNEDRREAGVAAETDVFLRGTDGQVVRRTSSGWTSMGIHASGTPAVVENAAGTQRTDLFYRDETNVLRHVYRTSGAWSTPATLTLPGTYRALADPVAVATPDDIDIVAVAAQWMYGPTIKTPCPQNPPFNEPTTPYRSNYDVFHWTWTPSGGLSEATPVTQNGQVLSDPNENRAPVGMPAVVRFNNQVHIFVRAENALLYHLKHNGSSWVATAVSTLPTGGFPTAVVANNAIRVFTRSLGYALYEFSGTGSGSWTASTVPVAMTGSPAAIVTSTR